MRLIEKSLVPGGAGSVKMVAEEPDDLWHAYNIISAGDRVLAETNRKVVLRDSSDACKAKCNARLIRLQLEVKVESSNYYGGDAAAVVRLHGKNVLQNGYVSVGQYHTLELQLACPFALTKARWDAAALVLLSEACGCQSLERRKKASTSGEEEGKKNKAAAEDKKIVEKNGDKGKKKQKEKEEEKTAEEKALEEFEALQRNQPDRICYGAENVALAAEWKAIGTLLVAERLFRSADTATRRRYAGLADAVKASKGGVRVFPATPGARDGALEMYAGVAAVLRVPLPQMEDLLLL